jgi:phytoene dehydrogenase-like protein
MFDVLIIGGGVSGMSCASIGLCKNKKFAAEKTIGFHHQKSSSLRKLFLITPMEFLKHWARIYCHKALNSYPNSILMSLKYQTKSLKVEGQSPDFTITTNKTL